MLGWKGRQDRQGVGGGGLTGGALKGCVSWSRKVLKEGPFILLGKFWREGAGSFRTEAGRGWALQEEFWEPWVCLGWPCDLRILISSISDPLNNIKEAERIKLLFSGWTLCSLCRKLSLYRKKKGSYAKIQQSDLEYKFLVLDLEMALATPTWPQPAHRSQRTVSQQRAPFPVGVGTERAVVDTSNTCPEFGKDEISNLPRKYPKEFIWLIKL